MAITLDDILPLLQGKKGRSKKWTALCPTHADQRNSLSITESSDGKLLLNCHANKGCTYENILEKLGIKQQPNGNGTKSAKDAAKCRIVAEYDYRDEDGNLLYQVVRYEPKGFSQRCPNEAGGWIDKLGNVRRVLYRLPELLESDPAHSVFIVEGEKDADQLAAFNVIATTNSSGAGKWRNEFNHHLRGRHVIIIPDNDPAGQKHAEKVANALEDIAADVRILTLPKDCKDISDWFDKGGSIDELHRLAKSAKVFTNASDTARLLAILQQAELWHTAAGDTYATFTNPKGYSETVLIKSEDFYQWLGYTYWQAERKTARKEALAEALSYAQSVARYEGVERQVFIRLAAHGGKFYLDLCDRERSVIEISRDGWHTINVATAPVRFRRTKGMLPLPVPMAGGDVRQLRQFVNVASDDDFTLLLAWLTAALRADAIKFPVLSITGEQGSAKSMMTLLLRNLIDPNTAPLRNSIRNVWDATLAANNSWNVTLNNLSELPQWLSDTLCCVADGIGFAARTHHSMTDETIFQAARPIIVNGISDIASRADLLDRAVCLHLPAIPQDRRIADAALFEAFEQARPHILGGLLTGVCTALRNLPGIALKELPRMADFAKWATAAESGLGIKAGAFMSAYSRNRTAANEAALEASSLATVLLGFMRERDGEPVTIGRQHLLDILASRFSDGKTPKDFPKTPRGLASELRRCAPNLRAVGLTAEDSGREGKNTPRMMTIYFDHPN